MRPGPSTTANQPIVRFRRGVAGRAPVLALAGMTAILFFLDCARAGQTKITPKPGSTATPGHTVVLGLSNTLATDDAEAFARLFSKDAEVRFGSKEIPAGVAGLWKALEQPPMSETTPFQVQEVSERGLSPDFEVVYAHMVQFGAVNLKHEMPLQLILRREGSAWRIVSFWVPQPLIPLAKVIPLRQ